MEKLRIIKFWVTAFSLIIWNVLKGKQWNMVYVDFDNGEGKDRAQYIARRAYGSYDIYWKDLGGF